MLGRIRRPPLGLALGATAVALLVPAATATARERCCFKATIAEEGLLLEDYRGGTDGTIGDATKEFKWTVRMILVYGEDRGGTRPRFRLARHGGAAVRPSTVWSSTSESSVQVKQPDGQYEPRARPGECGTTNYKWRRGEVPALQARRFASPGARAQFPRPSRFLAATFVVAFEDSLFCTARAGRGWEDQGCEWETGFSLPAPSRAWLRSGNGRVAKKVLCHGVHDEPSDDDRQDVMTGLGQVSLEWFPPSRLARQADRLSRAHRKALGR